MKMRGDDSKIVDVQLSLATHPKIIHLRKMEET